MAYLTLILFVSVAFIQFCHSASIDCRDNDSDCALLAYQNHCYRSKPWMTINCRKSCHLCDTVAVNYGCADSSLFCHYWAARGDCKISIWTRNNCKQSCKLCDRVGGLNYAHPPAPPHPKPSHSMGHHYPQLLTLVPSSHYGPNSSKKNSHRSSYPASKAHPVHPYPRHTPSPVHHPHPQQSYGSQHHTPSPADHHGSYQPQHQPQQSYGSHAPSSPNHQSPYQQHQTQHSYGSQHAAPSPPDQKSSYQQHQPQNSYGSQTPAPSPSSYQQQYPSPAHAYAPRASQPQPKQKEKCLPLDVAFMVDVGSNIKRSELAGIRTFLRHFTGNLPHDSRVGLVGFAEKIETAFDWVDRDEAPDNVFRLKHLSDSTYVTPALDYTRRRHFKRNYSPNPKIVIIIAKGDFDDKTRHPNSYATSITKAAGELGENAKIYVITPQDSFFHDNIRKLTQNRVYRAHSFQKFGEPVLWELIKQLCSSSASSVPNGAYAQPQPTENSYRPVQPQAQPYGQAQSYSSGTPKCQPVDIAYVTDVSNSISSTSMVRIKNFFRNLTEDIPGGSRVSMVSFAEQAREIFPFRTATSVMGLDLISGAKIIGGWTVLTEALDHVRRNHFMNYYKKKNVVLIVTDGDIEDDIREAADELNQFAEVFMVVPEWSYEISVIKNDMLILTESEDNIITVQDFTRLARKTVDQVLEKLCQHGEVERDDNEYRPSKAGQQFAQYGSIPSTIPTTNRNNYNRHGNQYARS